MSYIGNSSTTQTYVAAIDYFSGNGSTTAFTLSKPVAATPQVQVVVNNVPQNPTSAFTVSGSTLTFTSAPSSGTNNIYVYYTSPVTQVIAPSAGTVQSSSIASGGPTWDANGNVSTYNGGNISAGNTFGFKNRIINGAMMIDQRNAGAAVSLTAGGVYTLDRWRGWEDTDGTATVQQSTTAPAGFVNSLLYTVTSADASLGATQYTCLGQVIEGTNVSDFAWGTANAKAFTVSFWVNCSLTGTFGATVVNGANTRSYPFTYAISAANTWEYKTVTIPGCTDGVWATDTGSGLRLYLGLGVGSTYSAAAGSWQSGFYLSATGAQSVIGTNGATFYITGVQLEKGSIATPFDFRSYGTELALCQRYYQLVTSASIALNSIFPGRAYSTTAIVFAVNVPVLMRSAPTMTGGNLNAYSGAAIKASSGGSLTPTTVDGYTTHYTVAATGWTGLTNDGIYNVGAATTTAITLSSEL